MGFFDGLSDIVGGLRGLTGAVHGAAEDAAARRQPEDPSAIRKRELIAQQQGAINEFDKGRAGMMGQAVRSADTATRNALDNRLRGIKTDASRRGLLYSGVRQAGEAGARVGAAQQANQNRQILNKSFDRVRENMQNLLNRMQFNQAEEAVIMADQVYDQALQAANQDSGFIGSIMGAAGTAAGMYAGSLGGTKTAAPVDPSAGQGAGGGYQSGNVNYNRGTGYLGANTNFGGV